MKVEVLTSEREGDYTKYLLKHEKSLFNASIVFRDFIRLLCPDAIPYYLLAIDDTKEIAGVLPTFMKKGSMGGLGPVLNSMPWFGSNPGLLADDDEAAFFLLQAFENMAKWTHCFSSTFITPPNQDQFVYETFFEKKEVFEGSRKGLITPLPEFKDPNQFGEDLLKLVHQKTRNQILKGIQKCMAFETYTPDDWAFLKRVHAANMSVMGAPVKDKEFDIIRKHFRKGVDYKLYIALTNDAAAIRIAALLVEYFNKTVEYITPVIVPEYRYLCPMNLLIFSAMGDAAQLGYKWWNWGGTKLPSQEGVYHFKKRFGAVETEYKYYTRIYTDSIPPSINPKILTREYPYFFVIPYDLLGR